jgi:biofilm protein TabA
MSLQVAATSVSGDLMIFDLLANHTRYTGLGPNLAAAFDFLANTNLAALKPGRIDLKGEALYVLVQEYTTKPAEQGLWEAHRRYIDVQYILSGHERMGFAQLSTMQLGDYVPERDFQPMSGSGHTLDVFPGAFVIFHPQDAHMPGLAVNIPEPVKKIVVKVGI